MESFAWALALQRSRRPEPTVRRTRPWSPTMTPSCFNAADGEACGTVEPERLPAQLQRSRRPEPTVSTFDVKKDYRGQLTLQRSRRPEPTVRVAARSFARTPSTCFNGAVGRSRR